MNLGKLRDFLIASNKAGFAGGEEKKWIKEADGSTTIPYETGDWKSHDNFFGGEPYGGRIVVFYKNVPVWIMVYYGWVAEGIEANPVYDVLKGALMQMPDAAPFRGPGEYTNGELVYTNSWTGDVDRYSGEEQIKDGAGKLVYRANYFGGLVDRGKGVLGEERVITVVKKYE